MDFFFGVEKFHHLVTKINPMGLVERFFWGKIFIPWSPKEIQSDSCKGFVKKMHQNY
jgi:hypothetical protein